MGVCVVILVVENQLEALRSERAAEVPLPDRRVPVGAPVSTHLCPGLQGGYILYTAERLLVSNTRKTTASLC